MRKRKRRVVLAAFLAGGVMLLIVGGTAFITFGQEEQPKVPEIPGITVEDAKPQGCVDCHRKVSPERDYRLTVHAEEWTKEVPSELLKKAQAAAPPGVTMKGKHPEIGAVITTIPKDCLTCHSEQTAKTIGAPPFVRLLHLIHLVGGEENHFVTNYQGQCTHCHSLNKATGEWTIKSGKEQ
ncbi:MAG: cytochrome c3 family protein [bacterium]